MSYGIGVYEAGQESWVKPPPSGTFETLGPANRAPISDAMNCWPVQLKYQIVSLEGFGTANGLFGARDPYNGAFASGNYKIARVYNNFMRAYRSRSTHFIQLVYDDPPPYPPSGGGASYLPADATDTQDGVALFPSISYSGPWGNSHTYPFLPVPTWDSLADWTYATSGISWSTITEVYSQDPSPFGFDSWQFVSDEYDTGPDWIKIKGFINAYDMAPMWTGVDTVHHSCGIKHWDYDSSHSGAGHYSDDLWDTVDGGHMLSPCRTYGTPVTAPFVTYRQWGAISPQATPRFSNEGEGLYCHRVQVRFSLPVTWRAFEVAVGYGDSIVQYIKEIGYGILDAEEVAEVPAPTLYDGKPVVFDKGEGLMCCAGSKVYFVVDRTMGQWIAGGGTGMGAPYHTLSAGETLTLPPPPAATSDTSHITADSVYYTADRFF